MTRQLPLGLRLHDAAHFSNFVCGDDGELLDQLRQLAAGGRLRQLYCWGAHGSGKSHLLQACCRAADAAGHSAAYLSLRDAAQLAPAVLDGWEHYQLVCLDDIDAAAGAGGWEEALFHLYNRLVERGNRLLVSAAVAPAGLALELPDLVSRLAAGPVYQVHILDDEQSLRAMRLRAAQRGLDLPEETGRYLLRRLPRDLPALMNLLDRLDMASLAAQRKLTVPFVKSVLEL
jgi:DnaA family protein